MNKTFPTNGLVRVRDIVDFIKFSKATLWRRVKEKKFPQPIKDGRCTFFRAEEVWQYIESIGHNN